MNLISKKTIAAQLRRFAALMVSAAVLLCQSGITAFAETSEGQLHFYAEPCTVNAGEEIAVSFSVENNTGFAGFGVQMEYDESCFTPISVASEIGSGYMIDNTDTAEPGEFTIYWYDSENYTGNGAVFTVTLAVSENSYGLYEMLCIASEENTIQIAEDGTETAAACTWDHAEITVLNPELEAAPKLKLSSADVLAGDTAEIPLSFEQAEGISNAQISLEYDDAALTLKTITDADGEEVVYSDSAGCAVISVDTTEHALNDEWICTFSVHPYASGVSEIAASVSDAADSDGNPAAVLGASSFVTIQNDVYTMPVLVGENQQLTQPGAVTIPYTLLNPSCLMGMKLVIAFDPEFVEAESVSVQQDELLMDANMQSNVDYEKGEIVIAFYSGSPITENGTLFSLEMSVLESTVLTADYVPQDTYDGAYQYITMICCPTDIVIGSGTTETTTATTTTSQTTTVSTTTGHVATTADTSLSTSESTISTQSVTSATASSAVTTLRTSQTTTKPATTTETNTSSMTTTEPATTTATYTSSQTTTEPTTTTVTSTSSMTTTEPVTTTATSTSSQTTTEPATTTVTSTSSQTTTEPATTTITSTSSMTTTEPVTTTAASTSSTTTETVTITSTTDTVTTTVTTVTSTEMTETTESVTTSDTSETTSTEPVTTSTSITSETTTVSTTTTGDIRVVDISQTDTIVIQPDEQVRLEYPESAIIAWISSEPEIAEIDREGNVTVLGTGEITVTGVDTEGNQYTVEIVIQDESGLMGDVDEDGDVDIADATAALTMYAKFAAGLSTDEYTEKQKKTADVGGDGIVDIGDATAILSYYAQYAAGLNPTWDKILAL